MGILKWSVRIHKWVALIVGIQIMLWIAGGLVMSAIPIEQVRGEHKIAATESLAASPADLLELAQVTDQHEIGTISEAELGQVLGAPVWRLKSADGETFVIDASSGDRLDPVSETLARRIAEADYSGTGSLASVLSVANPPSEYGRPGPVWRALFDDGDATTLYIDPATAEVRARRSSTWRFYDFFWKLHVMDYDDGADFNHPLLITAAGAAIFVAMSGLVLLIIKMRRSLIAWRRRRAV
ncbi:PepSY domain-containing protein [Parvularcula marina]|uniref:PepSY domain-containing protein n=1 Tax=Parvularcula marina TaxID=2292771 RepID=UPI003515256B